MTGAVNKIVCASSEDGPKSRHVNVSVNTDGVLSVNNTRVRVCPAGINTCFTEWSVNETSGEIDIFKQGKDDH